MPLLPEILTFAFIGFIIWMVKTIHTVKSWRREDKKYRKENAKTKSVKAEPVQTQTKEQINYTEIIAEKDKEIQDLQAKLREYGYYGDLKGVEFVNQQIPASVPVSTVVPHTAEKRTEKKHHTFRNIFIGVAIFIAFNMILTFIF